MITGLLPDFKVVKNNSEGTFSLFRGKDLLASGFDSEEELQKFWDSIKQKEINRHNSPFNYPKIKNPKNFKSFYKSY